MTQMVTQAFMQPALHSTELNRKTNSPTSLLSSSVQLDTDGICLPGTAPAFPQSELQTDLHVYLSF